MNGQNVEKDNHKSTDKQQAAEHLIKQLYRCVDDRDAHAIGSFLAEEVSFKLGNFDPVVGKTAVVAANQAFFSTIAGMQHRITKVWLGDECTIICHGNVGYTRLDNSQCSAAFSTVLQVEQGKIIDYLVFVDISML